MVVRLIVIVIVVLSFLIVGCDSVEDTVRGNQCETPNNASSICTNQPENLEICTNGSETEAWFEWNGRRFDCSDDQCFANVQDLVNACNNFDSSSNLQITILATLTEEFRASPIIDNSLEAIVNSSAGDITLTRNGDRFVGGIEVEEGSTFSFILTIFGNVSGQNVIYATNTGEIDQAINRDVSIALTTDRSAYVDDDGDGWSNLAEIEAGTNHADPSATPIDSEIVQALESEIAIQPWLNQHLRCQNLVRGGGNFQMFLTPDGRVLRAFGLEPADVTTITYPLENSWQLNDEGFVLVTSGAEGEQWTIAEDVLFTTWTPSNGMRNCFFRP